VSGHIPELSGTWGLSTIILGKSVREERQAKREEIHMVSTTVRRRKFVCMKKRREQERELGVGAAMESEF
jgi:hypothetical protein